MKLNNYSYVHVKIRKISQYLEHLTDMKLITDFNEDFEDVRFVGKLSYITLDYRHHTCFAMSHHLTKQEIQIIDEIMVCLNWLEIGERYSIEHK